MSVSRRRADLEDDRLKAAIAFGFGATQDEAAEFAGVSVSSVKRWRTDPEIKRVSEAVAAYESVKSSKKVKNAINEAVGTAEERIRNLFGRATRLTERAVERVEQMGDEATLEELMEMHKQITVWASKYAASEAPKRMQIEGSVQHAHVHVVGLSDARNMLITGEQIDSALGRPLIAGESNVIDVTPSH